MKDSCLYCDNLLYDGFCYSCYYSDCMNWSLDLDVVPFPGYGDIDIYPDEEDMEVDDGVLFV